MLPASCFQAALRELLARYQWGQRTRAEWVRTLDPGKEVGGPKSERFKTSRFKVRPGAPSSFLLLVVRMLLVVRPGATLVASLLRSSRDARSPLLVANIAPFVGSLL